MNVLELKTEKQRKGITNKELSNLSGIPLGTVNKIMSGHIKSVKQNVYEKLKKAIVEDGRKNSIENYGFIKCGAVTPKIKVADVEYNVSQIKDKIKTLNKRGVQIMVFPEMVITGNTCGDLIFQSVLIKSVENALLEIAESSINVDGIIFVGAPLLRNGRIYDCAVAICNGRIIGVVPKTKVNGSRYFATPLYTNEKIEICGKEYPFGNKYIFENEQMPNMTIGVEIGEDLFSLESPSEKLALSGANIIVNLSGIAEEIGYSEYRKTVIKSQSGKCVCGYVYASTGYGESSTDEVYAGHNIIAENGEIIKENELFCYSDVISDIDVERIEYEREKVFRTEVLSGEYERIKFSCEVKLNKLDRVIKRTPFITNNETEMKMRAEQILTMQAEGLKKRIEHTGAKSLVIGVSGGLDSTLALLVCSRALKTLKRDNKEILAITMPCFGTTKRTKGNAEKLAELLGCTLKEIDIAESVRKHFKDIGQSEENRDVTYENSQARERTQVLMDVANQTGGMVVGTGDLSELALGWATYNGDHMSMYGVNAGLPKTLIKYLILNESKKSKTGLKEVLKDVVDTPVSPELIPPKDGEIKQKTEDVIGPYILHDFYLYNIIKLGCSPKKAMYKAKIAFQGEYDEKELYKWLENFIRRFISQQFKRSCLPDGIKIVDISLSPRGAWAMPSDATKSVWQRELNEIKSKIE